MPAKRVQKHKSKSGHTYSRKQTHKKSWFFKYRVAILGILGLVAVVLGIFSYAHKTGVLGASTLAMVYTGDGSVGQSSCHNETIKNQCNKTTHQVCDNVVNSCSTSTVLSRSNCRTVEGSCGVPAVCKYTTAYQCGTKGLTASSCKGYDQYDYVKYNKPINSACAVGSCISGGLSFAKCGIPDLQDHKDIEDGYDLTVTSFTCRVAGSQYVFGVSGTVKSIGPSFSMPSRIDLNVIIERTIGGIVSTKAPTISIATIKAGQYNTTFSKNVYVDKSHIANVRVIGAYVNNTYTGSIPSGVEIAAGDESNEKLLDLTKCK